MNAPAYTPAHLPVRQWALTDDEYTELDNAQADIAREYHAYCEALKEANYTISDAVHRVNRMVEYYNDAVSRWNDAIGDIRHRRVRDANEKSLPPALYEAVCALRAAVADDADELAEPELEDNTLYANRPTGDAVYDLRRDLDEAAKPQPVVVKLQDLVTQVPTLVYTPNAEVIMLETGAQAIDLSAGPETTAVLLSRLDDFLRQVRDMRAEAEQ